MKVYIVLNAEGEVEVVYSENNAHLAYAWNNCTVVEQDVWDI